MPNDWHDLIANDMSRPHRDKQLYYLIWELDGTAIGHSHINDIEYGSQAFMHLHVWDASERQRGLGTRFVRASVPIYFEAFKLDRLYCQPHARSEAPNRTLARAGFEFVETIEALQRGFADVKAGRTKPAREVFERLRRKHGVPR